MKPLLKQVKASAGSGKTYQLTRRFLGLLDGACEDGYACRGKSLTSYSWPEILAITFTNKAASEMKERVIRDLKNGALGLGSGGRESFDPKRDAERLESILRGYHKLNIRTIDSLLTAILRLFALERGMRPDFEVVFNEADMFDEVMDAFVSRCENDGMAQDQLHAAVETLLYAEESTGFKLVEKIRERALALCQFIRNAPADLCLDQNAIRELIKKKLASVKRDLAAVTQYIADNKLPASKNWQNAAAKAEALDIFDSPPDSKLFEKDSLSECVNKAGKDKIEPVGDNLYIRFSESMTRYRSEHELLLGAYGLIPALVIAQELQEKLEELQRRKGQVLNADTARTVDELLALGGVSEAFCRLGCRLHHLLVDEFQDTDRSQWRAVTPLGEECLSKGGSLYYVGDVKQAIYGWRGGDSRLFDEVAEMPELAGPAGGGEKENLENNWRSYRRVVEFNNTFFANLESKDRVDEIAPLLMGEHADEASTIRLADDMAAAFTDCAQGVAPPNLETDGYVKFVRLPESGTEEFRENVLDTMEEFVDEVRARRPLSDIAVLIRSHKEAALVCDRLVAKGIPVITESSLRLDKHPIVQQLVAFLAWLDYPADDISFAGFVTGRELFLAESGLAESDVHAWLAAPRKSSAGASFSETFPDAWNRCIRPFMGRSGIMSPYDIVRDTASFYRILDRFPGAELYLRRFLEVVHLAEDNGHGSLTTFLDYWRENSSEEKVPLPENMEAVRIMTIHKSKGLEFPVVIVPFHHWDCKPSEKHTVLELDGLHLATPLRRKLGQPYWDKQADAIREQSHLLYVAWTRAREELYGCWAPKLERSRRPMLDLMEMLLGPDTVDNTYEYGTPPEAKEAAPTQNPPEDHDIAPGTEQPELMAWLPRLRVYRHTREEAQYDQLMRGEIIHKMLEEIRFTGDYAADTRRALQMALDAFPASAAMTQQETEQLQQDSEAIVQWIAEDDRLHSLVSEGRVEQELMNEKGEFFRIDLLHMSNGKATVVDYKTGDPTPKNHEQVRQYMQMLSEMEHGPSEIEGLLIYLDHREVVAVAAEGK